MRKDRRKHKKKAILGLKKRYGWLASVINKEGYKAGAEIGCLKGVTTRHILRYCPGLQLLYAVDLWSWDAYEGEEGHERLHDRWNFPVIKRHFNRVTREFSNRLTVLEGISWDMAEKVKDGSLDFVFIDANHSYECVAKDIKAWTPKLHPGGMLCGHDFSEKRAGVIKAVTELVSDFSLGVDHVWMCKKEDVIC